MRVSLGADAARRNVDETITGLWTFANVLGLLTDIIGERTAAAGVTVDGLLIRDAGIPEAAVTAHEAALAILMSQVTGNIPDGQVPASAVTQHEAALAILESQITPGSLLARLADDETVAGSWTFTNRIEGGNGIAFDTLPLATSFAYLARVVGATFAEFAVQANGDITWGDGTGARDTNLFRDAANVLKTDDGFRVGGFLSLESELFVSERAMSLTLGVDNDDVATGTAVIQRIPTVTAGTAITGFAGGTAGRIIMVQSAASVALPINDEDAGSVAANRIIGPQGSIISLAPDEGVMFHYDGTDSRWRTLSLTT